MRHRVRWPLAQFRLNDLPSHNPHCLSSIWKLGRSRSRKKRPRSSRIRHSQPLKMLAHQSFLLLVSKFNDKFDRRSEVTEVVAHRELQLKKMYLTNSQTTKNRFFLFTWHHVAFILLFTSQSQFAVLIFSYWTQPLEHMTQQLKWSTKLGQYIPERSDTDEYMKAWYKCSI